MKKIWFLLILTFSVFSFRNAGERMITGVVTSAHDGSAMPGVTVQVKGTQRSVATGADGKYQITVAGENAVLVFSFTGFVAQEIQVGANVVINVELHAELMPNVPVNANGLQRKTVIRGMETDATKPESLMEESNGYFSLDEEQNTEEYAGVIENIFRDPLQDPLSTFSVDVDRASYSNVRRFINSGQRPPADAVRIEEMINYFDYDYPQPQGQHPFAIYTEASAAPWNTQHQLVHIGIQGKTMPTGDLPPSNLVFLIDVSGSMDAPNKLPLVKHSFAMLVDQLRQQDKVAIVVYAGAAGVVLEPTRGNDKARIINALDRLQAGGSTAGGAGLRLAYALAAEQFQKNGNNRVIIATDGDFNVGESSNAAMEKLITEKRQDGIFLTVLGYGMGNYKDSKLEILADKGNGNYAYIDNITEARKTLVSEFAGTLFTIAKDVKIQVEFNPAKVKAYRLLGYENRLLNREDFNNDRKDAGEIGSGHTVTALYEIIPAGVTSEFFDIDPLKYQTQASNTPGGASTELLTVKVRYKEPNGVSSILITHPHSYLRTRSGEGSENFRWAASVAAFGMLLRESPYLKAYSYEEVVALAQGARGKDMEGYRAEFISMAKSLGMLTRR